MLSSTIEETLDVDRKPELPGFIKAMTTAVPPELFIFSLNQKV
jgi:hypothetical protein